METYGFGLAVACSGAGAIIAAIVFGIMIFGLIWCCSSRLFGVSIKAH